mmetsp:Transcript_25032/g.62621  ORF Transcript_25032/g.62621 Transcript_25032/m.62621 type:complete len:259 (-) Transcript_25032:462-1238(-)
MKCPSSPAPFAPNETTQNSSSSPSSDKADASSCSSLIRSLRASFASALSVFSGNRIARTASLWIPRQKSMRSWNAFDGSIVEYVSEISNERTYCSLWSISATTTPSRMALATMPSAWSASSRRSFAATSARGMQEYDLQIFLRTVLMTLWRMRATRESVLSLAKTSWNSSTTAPKRSRSPTRTADAIWRYGASASTIFGVWKTARGGITPVRSWTTTMNFVTATRKPHAAVCGALRRASWRHLSASAYSSWTARMRPR